MSSERPEFDKEDWKKMFSEKLDQLIGEESISKIANKIDIETKTLYSYIKQKAVPTALNLAKIASYFGVSADELITPEPSKSKEPPAESKFSFNEDSFTALAGLINDLDVNVERSPESPEKVTLTINDRMLAMALSELFMAKGSPRYDNIAKSLSKSIGTMRPFNGNLTDYETFMSMIRHEFIYGGLEDGVIRTTDSDGNEVLGIVPDIHEKIERRTAAWNELSPEEREKWWQVRSKRRNK